MAEHKHGTMDTKVQVKTFDGFMAWTKWTVIVILVTLVLMGIFLTF